MTNGKDRTLSRAFVAGTAGGVMEVLWIGLVAAVLGVDTWQVARGITATVAPAAAASVLACGGEDAEHAERWVQH